MVIVPALAVVFEFAAAVVPLLLLSVVDWLFVLDEDELVDELEMAGLDIDELADMDEDERREALEDAGLDPDDFDNEF